MSKKEHVSATPATMWLKQHKVPFEDGIYEYVEHGGTAQAAACFGVDEHNVVKTLIMQDEHEKPLVILMHGDREVSTKNLARQILSRDFSVTVHQDDERFLMFVLHDKRLYDVVFIHTETRGCLSRAAVFHILINSVFKGHFMLLQPHGCRRGRNMFFLTHSNSSHVLLFVLEQPTFY